MADKGVYFTQSDIKSVYRHLKSNKCWAVNLLSPSTFGKGNTFGALQFVLENRKFWEQMAIAHSILTLDGGVRFYGFFSAFGLTIKVVSLKVASGLKEINFLAFS